jgi:hypothetical protein
MAFRMAEVEGPATLTGISLAFAKKIDTMMPAAYVMRQGWRSPTLNPLGRKNMSDPTKHPLPSETLMEAKGTMNIGFVDRSLLLAVLQYMVEQKLVESFNQHLEQNAIYDVMIDVSFVNQLKRFLLTTKNRDALAIVALGCGCSGGGGGPGTPSGVRG